MKKILLSVLTFVLLLTCSTIANAYDFLDEFTSDNWINKVGNVSVSESKTIIGADSSCELSLGGFDVSESGTVTVEMKMTVNSYGRSASLPAFYGKTSLEEDSVSLVKGTINKSKRFTIGAKSTGVEAVAGNAYIMKYTFDFINNNVKLAVYDGENVLLGESNTESFQTGNSKIFVLDKIGFSTVNPLELEIDYIKIGDGSFKITSLNVEENDVVTIDKDIIFKLNGAVDESTLNNISVMCGEESIEYEISKNENGEYVIYFPYGLSYNTNYVLTIPKTVLSDGDGLSLYERVVNFKTEMHPYYVKNIALSETDLSEKTSVSLEGVFVNNMAADVDASIMVIIYNQSGAIVNTYYKTHTATKGGESTVSGTIDLSGTTNAKTAKIYVWDNLFGMNDVIIAD